MEKITVIITGAGAPGIAGTIYALKAPSQSICFRIITTDINPTPVGQYLADGFYQLPAPENEHYLPTLLEIVRKENVKVIIPQTTREINILSQHKKTFREQNCEIVVSDYAGIHRANDKYHILKECEKTGVPYPRYHLINNQDQFQAALAQLDYPKQKVVVKPRHSNGMRGLRILTEEPMDIDTFVNTKPSGLTINLENLLRIFDTGIIPQFLVTEYLPGDEYSVDVFRNHSGIVVIPRLREQIRSGISFHTTVTLREDIIDYSRRLAQSLDLHFCFGFQYKLDDAGVPKILESNPRVQGTMVTSVFAGFNMVYQSVIQCLGLPVVCDQALVKDNVQFKRYWGGISIHNKKLLYRI